MKFSKNCSSGGLRTDDSLLPRDEDSANCKLQYSIVDCLHILHIQNVRCKITGSSITSTTPLDLSMV
jgi:hypothetical protein